MQGPSGGTRLPAAARPEQAYFDIPPIASARPSLSSTSLDAAGPRLPSSLPPEEEARRLAAVRRYDILDTPPDGSFDRITALAAQLFAVPISIISLVDHDRIWFKSHHGLEVQQIGRDPGL